MGYRTAKGKPSPHRKTAHRTLVQGKTRRTKTLVLRRCLIEVGIPHECFVCKRGPTWEGLPLVLQIDHVNGDWSDDRQENLRFLCPNCHSQQPTSITPKSRAFRPCDGCGSLYRAKNKSRFCNRKCSSRSVVLMSTHPEKARWPGVEELRNRVWAEPVEKVALSLGVSGRAVHKRCERLGIRTPPRGYWAKVRHGVPV
jgi:ribosomal protein L24E